MAVGRVLDRALGWETPPPRLNETQVLQIARATAEAQGWPWEEPVSVGFTPGSRRTPGEWEVFTNARCKGGNVIIRINDATGAVLNQGFARH